MNTQEEKEQQELEKIFGGMTSGKTIPNAFNLWLMMGNAIQGKEAYFYATSHHELDKLIRYYILYYNSFATEYRKRIYFDSILTSARVYAYNHFDDFDIEKPDMVHYMPRSKDKYYILDQEIEKKVSKSTTVERITLDAEKAEENSHFRNLMAAAIEGRVSSVVDVAYAQKKPDYIYFNDKNFYDTENNLYGDVCDMYELFDATKILYSAKARNFVRHKKGKEKQYILTYDYHRTEDIAEAIREEKCDNITLIFVSSPTFLQQADEGVIDFRKKFLPKNSFEIMYSTCNEHAVGKGVDFTAILNGYNIKYPVFDNNFTEYYCNMINLESWVFMARLINTGLEDIEAERKRCLKIKMAHAKSVMNILKVKLRLKKWSEVEQLFAADEIEPEKTPYVNMLYTEGYSILVCISWLLSLIKDEKQREKTKASLMQEYFGVTKPRESLDIVKAESEEKKEDNKEEIKHKEAVVMMEKGEKHKAAVIEKRTPKCFKAKRKSGKEILSKLSNLGLISRSTKTEQVEQAFGGIQAPKNKIDWTGSQKDLAAIIKHAKEMGYIDCTSIWQTTASCFKIRGKEIDSDAIRKSLDKSAEMDEAYLDIF